MKIEILKLGNEGTPHIKLTGQSVKDAVALGSLAEKCHHQGLAYSSNTGNDDLPESTAPYVCLALVRTRRDPDAVNAKKEEIIDEEDEDDDADATD